MASATIRGTGAQHAYSELRQKILSLELKPGSRLFEENLAATLGLSRTPVREAVRQLISENLLERQPAGGLAVPELDTREIEELYDVRAAVESLMAADAARLATADDIRELEAIVARNAALVELPDEAMRTGASLHAAIAEIAANSWAIRLHEQVASQMERYKRFTNNSSDRRHAALAQHRSIVELIAARDVAGAGAMASKHVIDARDVAVRAVGTSLDK